MTAQTSPPPAGWLVLVNVFRSTFGFNTEEKHDEKNAGLKRGNSNWGNMNIVKSGNSYQRKYQNIKVGNCSSNKWGRWTCVVTYWFEKFMDVSTFVLYC